MANSIKIGAFKKLAQAKLPPYSQNVLDRTKDKAPYAEAAKEVETLQLAHDHYIRALAASQTGGKAETEAKNKAKKELEMALETLAKKLMDIRPDDGLYYVEAGYDLKDTTKRHDGPIPMPINVMAHVSTTPGTVKLHFTLPQPGRVVNNEIAYQIKGTTEWIALSRSTRLFNTIEDLPRAQTLILRVRSIGRGYNNLSAWTISNEVPVL